MMSFVPPGGNPTKKRTGRDGNPGGNCAGACAAAPSKSAPTTNCLRIFEVIAFLRLLACPMILSDPVTHTPDHPRCGRSPMTCGLSACILPRKELVCANSGRADVRVAESLF